MGLDFKKQTVSTGLAVWSTVHETAIGGFTLDRTGIAEGALLAAGTPIWYDESTRMAKIIKTAILNANALNNDTSYQVKKNSGLVVGEFVAGVKGGPAHTITGINTSNADYDVVTLDATLGAAMTANQGLFQSSAAGATAGAFSSAPKGLLYEDTVVDGIVSVSVVLRGTLYARRAPVANADLQASLPLIIFSQSY